MSIVLIDIQLNVNCGSYHKYWVSPQFFFLGGGLTKPFDKMQWFSPIVVQQALVVQSIFGLTLSAGLAQDSSIIISWFCPNLGLFYQEICPALAQ